MRFLGRGRALRLTAVGAAVAATVALSQATASGAFVGVTGNASNSGFVFRDRAENATPTSYEQVYHDRQDVTYRPTPVLTWG